MKTKKEILEWWENLGKTDMNPKYTDKQSFWDNIETGMVGIVCSSIKIEVLSRRWKHSLKLYFTEKGECYRIVGF